MTAPVGQPSRAMIRNTVSEGGDGTKQTNKGRLSMRLQRGRRCGIMGIHRTSRPPPVSAEPTQAQWDDYLSYGGHQQQHHYLAADQQKRVMDMKERASKACSITPHECAEAAERINWRVFMVTTEDLEIAPSLTHVPANEICREYRHPDGSYKWSRPDTDQPLTSAPGYPPRPNPRPPSPGPPKDRSTQSLVWTEPTRGWQRPQGTTNTAQPAWGATNRYYDWTRRQWPCHQEAARSGRLSDRAAPGACAIGAHTRAPCELDICHTETARSTHIRALHTPRDRGNTEAS